MGRGRLMHAATAGEELHPRAPSGRGETTRLERRVPVAATSSSSQPEYAASLSVVGEYGAGARCVRGRPHGW